MNKKSSDRGLFNTQSGHTKDYIVLNWHGRPIEEFGLYAEAYHRAAMRLVQDYGTTGAVRDIEAVPILFFYRHAFELYLKAFVLIGSKILHLQGKPSMSPKEIFDSHHKLAYFIPTFEAIIKEVGWSWDMGVEGLKRKSDFVTLVKEFESIDPGSYSFRYPTTKDGKGSLPDHFSFNLTSFAQRIDPLLQVLDGALSGLRECWDKGFEV